MSSLEALKAYLRGRAPDGIALAYSGGVDSSLLLAVLKSLHDEQPFPWVAYFAYSLFQHPRELEAVRHSTTAVGIELKLFACDPLAIPEVKHNAPDRCYWCKRTFFSQFREDATRNGFATVLDGTNADDLKSWRPGLAALAELQVVSPLAVCGMTKATVREWAAALKLPCAEKPSVPCMATRFEYGTELSEAYVQKVMAGEDIIRNYVPTSADVRLRVHGAMARIEVGRAEISTLATHAATVAAELKKLGFEYVTLDLEGFRSGSMDNNQDEQRRVRSRNGENEWSRKRRCRHY